MLRAFAFLAISIVAAGAYGHVIYVNDDAAGANDGSSWTDALTDLQAALDIAQAGDEIWVAAGMYKPRGAAGVERNATFQLESGVAIYGGFAGSETIREQRDPTPNATILSGDLRGDDDPSTTLENLADDPTRQDNTYHVVTGSGTDATAELNGFVITAGQANGEDAGITDSGGGVYNRNGSPSLVNCSIVRNSATGGDFGGGGAMYNVFRSAPTLIDSTFDENWARRGGGGMYNTAASTPTLTRCLFSRNSTRSLGGTSSQGPAWLRLSMTV